MTRSVKQMKVILHAGIAKTGTTTIQRFLDDNQSSLETAGIYCPSKRKSQKRGLDIRKALMDMRYKTDPTDAIAALNDRVSGLAKAGYTTLLISDEDMLGLPFSDKYQRFFGTAFRNTSLLKRAFQGHSVCMVIALRELVSFLPSYYGQYIRLGGTLGLKTYLDKLDYDKDGWQNWLPQLEAVLAPEASILWHSYRGTKSDVEAMAALICDAAGVSFFTLDQSAFAQQHNASLPAYTLPLLRLANRTSAHNDRMTQVRRQRNLRRLLEPVFAKLPKGKTLALPPAYKTKIAALDEAFDWRSN